MQIFGVSAMASDASVAGAQLSLAEPRKLSQE